MMASLCVVMQGQTLMDGGQFMDRILPMEGNNLSSDVWGAPGVKPRLVDNGIEDATYSYWGGNIVKAADGKYHLNIAGWPEKSNGGHATWSSGSMVYHAVADNIYGPYENIATIGEGHNTETYRAKDGTWVIYIIGGYYTAESLDGPWTKGEYEFDLRGRALIAGEDRKVSLSNCTFAPRQDGSVLMVDRGGGVWVSRDGLHEPWRQLTDATVYSGNRRYFEDPVIWRDSLQYHMIVNDWNARIAYYSRSLDGFHWVTEAGTAYAPGVARHKDGTVEDWYKYERPKVYLDESGRASYFNLAVIDTIKGQDKGNDHHSSKNIIMPLNKGLLLEVLNTEQITAATTEIKVLVKAEAGFNPQTDLDISSLLFGNHSQVNYGKGFKATATEVKDNDLVITFTGTSGASGITADEFAPKMLGKNKQGEMVYGYAKLSYVNYRPAILSAMMPTVGEGNNVESMLVENFGLSASAAVTVQIRDNNNRLLAEGEVPAVASYDSQTVSLTSKLAVQKGTSKFVISFKQDGKEIMKNTFSTEGIALSQTTLANLVDSATVLLTKTDYTEGKEALQKAVDEAKLSLNVFDADKLAVAVAALKKAIRAYHFANGNVVENYDFYTWAMTSGATLYMTDKTVNVTDGSTTHSVKIADKVSDGKTTQYFNGRLAFDQGGNNFNLRDKGVNNASSGLFDFNKDSYFSVLNLKPGDEVTLVVTGEPAYFVSTNAYKKGDETKTPVVAGSEVGSGTTYIITGAEGSKTQLDIKGIHYTTIKQVNVKTSEKERISAPSYEITSASYDRRTITIIPGMGTAGTDAEKTLYTLDGTDVTEIAKEYTVPFVIEDTTTLKAVSYLPDGTPSDTLEAVIPAGTTLELNAPNIVITSLIGDNNSPVIDVKCDNSNVIGNPDVTLMCTVDGVDIELPYTFTEEATLKATVRAEGYEEREVAITLAGEYEQKQTVDYTAITKDNIKSVLGSSWTVGSESTRWAFWSTGDTYYVATTSQTGDISIGGNMMTTEGKYLLMGYGMGRNITEGTTRFWMSNAEADALVCYEVNETRDNSGKLTSYYVSTFNSPTLDIYTSSNYTLAKAHKYLPKAKGSGIENVPVDNTAQQSVSHDYYTLQGVKVEHPTRGIYIRSGKKIIVR